MGDQPVPGDLLALRQERAARHLRPISVDEALGVLLERLAAVRQARRLSAPTEVVALERALGRVAAEEVRAENPIPGFARSTVDGYAVRAAEVAAATPEAPVALRPAGEVQMGRPAQRPLQPGEAVWVPTGGMVPQGADAVVMVEKTRAAGGMLWVLAPVAPGANLFGADEDLRQGAVLVPPCRRLRPQELGALAAAGYAEVGVLRRPRLCLVSTGDELVDPGTPQAAMTPGQVRDINRVTLAAMAANLGAEPVTLARVPDELEALQAVLRQAVEELAADIVVVSGGSSVGDRDHTLAALESLGEVFVRGVAIKPGKPTLIGVREAGPGGGSGAGPGDGATRLLPQFLFGLPGHPVSAMVTFQLFVRPAVLAYQGLSPRDWPERTAQGVLQKEVVAGDREEFVRVALRPPAVIPIPSKSGAISSMVAADGLLRVPAGTRMAAGATVQVTLFD